MRAWKAAAGLAGRVVGVRSKHLGPSSAALAVELGPLGFAVYDLDREQSVRIEQRSQRVSGQPPRTGRPVDVGENGDRARLADGLHHPNGRFLRCVITLSGDVTVADIAKQPVDVGGMLVRVENGKDVDVAVSGHFHAGEQTQRQEVLMLFFFQIRECRLQSVDPLTRVVIRDGYTIHPGAHEAEEPVLGCDSVQGSLISSFPIVRGRWRVGMEVELPPTRPRVRPPMSCTSGHRYPDLARNRIVWYSTDFMCITFKRSPVSTVVPKAPRERPRFLRWREIAGTSRARLAGFRGPRESPFAAENPCIPEE